MAECPVSLPAEIDSKLDGDDDDEEGRRPLKSQGYKFNHVVVTVLEKTNKQTNSGIFYISGYFANNMKAKA